MLKRFSKQALYTILAIVLAIYLFVQFFLSISVTFDVENVYMTLFESKKSLDVYIFRDESPIYSDNVGEMCCYPVKNGEKVQKGQEVVTTYHDLDDVRIQERINEIDAKIEIIKKSGAASLYTSNDLSKIENNISLSMIDVIKYVKDKKIGLSSETITDINVLLNNKQAIINGKSTLDEVLKSLEAEKTNLTSELSGNRGTIKSSMSGYFYSAADGFESYFNEKALDELTLEKFDDLKEVKPDQTILNSSVGKIASSSKWYIACCMTKRQATGLKEGSSYPFTFPNSFGARINMKFERKISQSDNDTVIMIFSSSILKEEFDFSRKQTAEFVFETYEGLKVPTSAIRYIDGRNGVYALEGSKVVFKEIKIKSVQSSYCIIYLPDEYTTEEEKEVAKRIEEATAAKLELRDENGALLPQYRSHQKLDLYDAIIIGGKNLEEGMMVR